MYVPLCKPSSAWPKPSNSTSAMPLLSPACALELVARSDLNSARPTDTGYLRDRREQRRGRSGRLVALLNDKLFMCWEVLDRSPCAPRPPCRPFACTASGPPGTTRRMAAAARWRGGWPGLEGLMAIAATRCRVGRIKQEDRLDGTDCALMRCGKQRAAAPCPGVAGQQRGAPEAIQSLLEHFTWPLQSASTPQACLRLCCTLCSRAAAPELAGREMKLHLWAQRERSPIRVAGVQQKADGSQQGPSLQRSPRARVGCSAGRLGRCSPLVSGIVPLGSVFNCRCTSGAGRGRPFRECPAVPNRSGRKPPAAVLNGPRSASGVCEVSMLSSGPCQSPHPAQPLLGQVAWLHGGPPRPALCQTAAQ